MISINQPERYEEIIERENNPNLEQLTHNISKNKITISLTNNNSSWLETSCIPEELSNYGMNLFDALFNMKPEKRHKIITKETGENMEVFRWQQSYLKTPNYDKTDEYFKTHYYMYSGIDTTNNNNDLPKEFLPFYEYVKKIDDRYNQVIINWYNSEDYIDFHRDCQRKLLKDVPIIVITLMSNVESFREFEIIPYEKNSEIVIPLYSNIKIITKNGSMIKMCGDIQTEFRHGMKASEINNDDYRRISMSFRAFE